MGSARVSRAGRRVSRRRTFLNRFLQPHAEITREVREGATPSPALATSALPEISRALDHGLGHDLLPK